MPDTPQFYSPDLAIADGFFKSSDVFITRGCTRFVLANGAKSTHSWSMKIVEDVRKYAAEQRVSDDEMLKKRMEAKSKESVEERAEVYAKA